ncbi:hypothetical protein IEQ44_04640 [Nocardioides sp. Y6]|uniref:CcmD family protein n=1 Tax=Nocardioides malaquae TaxID=2773426 RepID=A0ABR9RQU7_9ACTN|nr:hypothetical protein [Nocardioides malaquae]MBE7323936.1 hypothetical protein [Nocardioides malaquae]
MLELLTPDVLSSLLVAIEDAPRPVPEDSEVKAGYIALFLWLGMAVAVALLGWSLVRQFRKVNAAREAGVYDDPAAPRGRQGRLDENGSTDEV